jgi:hypothetical protein
MLWNNDWWLHQLPTNGGPFDAIGLIASIASASDLACRSDETHRFGSFQHDRTEQKLDAIIRR